MEARFDVFKSEGGGAVRWVEAVGDRATAKDRVLRLGESWPGSYIILDQNTGDKIRMEVGSPEVQTPRNRMTCIRHIQTESLEQERDELKAKRNTLFEKYLTRPDDLRLAVEIKGIDDRVAECNHQIVEAGGRL